MTDKPKTDEPSGGDKYKRLIAAAQKATRIKVAVAHPCDDVSLSGAIEAHKLGLIDPILVGPAFETQPKRPSLTSAGSSSSRRRTATIRRRRRSASSPRAGSRR
jgi:phosphate acetyltransferase